jgi:hypothetical protein
MGLLDLIMPDSGKDTVNGTNDAVTTAGGLDAATRASQAGGTTAPFHQHTYAFGEGLPGGNFLGHLGGALSVLGVVDNAVDIAQHGINENNSVGMLGSGLGAASYAATLAPGLVAAEFGPVGAAGAAGVALGTQSNEFIADTGLLGKNVDGKTNRSWSDMASDWGMAADEAAGGGALGTAAGLAATTAGSVVGTAGTVASSGLVAADMALDVGSAGLDLAGDAWDSIWD